VEGSFPVMKISSLGTPEARIPSPTSFSFLTWREEGETKTCDGVSQSQGDGRASYTGESLSSHPYIQAPSMCLYPASRRAYSTAILTCPGGDCQVPSPMVGIPIVPLRGRTLTSDMVLVEWREMPQPRGIGKNALLIERRTHKIDEKGGRCS